MPTAAAGAENARLVRITRVACDAADEYIRSLSHTVLKSYAVALWDCLCSDGYSEPDPTYYGLAPIEVRASQAILREFAS